MPAQPIHPELLPAYFNAGIAVTAFEYGVTVRRLSLQIQSGRRARPSLTQFPEYAKGCKTKNARGKACLDYVTVLLSGNAGRLIGLERHLGYAGRELERSRLERAFQGEARATSTTSAGGTLAATATNSASAGTIAK